MEKTMFFRFYNQTQENINKCISELKKNAKGLIKTTIDPLTQSCNPLIFGDNNFEVNFYFETEQDLWDFYNNENNHQIYMGYCNGANIPCTLVKRKPGDLAFPH